MKRPSTRLFLIRHGEVEEKYHRTFGGRIDMNLSELGKNQARQLAEYLAPIHFDALYTSPMIRARQTLAPLARQHRPEAGVIDGLREIDFGAWTGLSWAQVQEKFGRSAFDWLTHVEQDEIPDAENTIRFRGRVEPALRQILESHPSQRVAIVCHGGVIRMILSILLELPLPKTAGFEVDYASLSVVDVRDHRSEIALLNYAPWTHPL